jgi:hypothetical protein
LPTRHAIDTIPAMPRRSLWPIWTAFLLSLVAFLSYPLFFARFPVTRDFPWANLLLFALALVLAVVGVRRSFAPGRKPIAKASGILFTVFTVALIALFIQVVFYEAKKLPSSQNSPKVGQKAPAFTLPDSNNKAVALSDLLAPANGVPPQGVLLVFYRGYW